MVKTMFNDLLGEREEKPTLQKRVEEKFKDARPKRIAPIRGGRLRPEDIQKYISRVFGDSE